MKKGEIQEGLMAVLNPLSQLLQRVVKVDQTNLRGISDFARRTRAQTILNTIVSDYSIDVLTFCTVCAKIERSMCNICTTYLPT